MRASKALFILVLFCSEHLFARIDTIEYHFELNIAKAVDSKLKLLLEQRGLNSDFFMDNAIEITVSAYADCAGSREYNLAISQKRATSIAHYFASQNNDNIKVIEAVGYGEQGCKENDVSFNAAMRKASIVFKSKLLKEIEKPIGLADIGSLAVGESLILNGLTFNPGSDIPTAKGELVLQELLKILKENSTYKIEIQGHICCFLFTGDNDPDLKTGDLPELSIRRAKYVYDYLIRKEIAASRLSYKGFGGEKPLHYPEVTDEDKIANRRVEVVLLEK